MAATRLERQMGAAHSIRTRDNVAYSRVNNHQHSCWALIYILTLKGKELELIEEAKRYHLDIVGVHTPKKNVVLEM